MPTTALAGGQSLVIIEVAATPQPPQHAGATTAPVQLVLPWQLLRWNLAFNLSRMLGPWQLLPWQLLAGVPVQLLTGVPVQLLETTVLPMQLAGAVTTTLAPWQLPWHEPRSRPKDAVSPPVVAAIMSTIVYIQLLLILVQPTRMTMEKSPVARPFRNELRSDLSQIGL